MNLIKNINSFLLGKKLLLTTTLAVFAFSLFAQTTITCKSDFEYKIDHNTKTIKLVGKSNFKTAVFGYDLGDGNFKRGQEIKHTYANAGDYKVCMKVIAFNTTTNQRCTTEVCKKIKIVDCDRLEAKFAYEVEGFVVKVKGKTNSNNVSTGFKFGDGNGARGLEAKHRYAKPGTYKICFVAEDLTYGCRVEVCKRVIIEKKACDLEADFKIESEGLSIKVLAKANQEHVNFFWAFGDGNDASGQRSGHTYKKAGSYEVCLIAFNQRTKCKTMVCKKVEVEKPCGLKADFKMRKHRNKVLFKVRTNASKKSLYTWDFGDGTKVTTRKKVIRHKYAKKGKYQVTLIVSDKRRECRTRVVKRLVIGSQQMDQVIEPNKIEDATQEVVKSPVNTDTWVAKASPSPARGTISFSSVDKNVAQVRITNLNGTEVVSTSTQLNNLDISTLGAGFYYAHVTAADGTTTIVKFIKD